MSYCGSTPANWAKKWSAEEDERLRSAIQQYGDDKWKKVADVVGTREAVNCMQRWERVLRPGIVKGTWTTEEDQHLISLVAEGHQNWSKIAKGMSNRTSKQCRERWINYLDPSLKHSAFTEEEDTLLLKLHSELGNKWATIAKIMTGRNENNVKTRYHTLQKFVRRKNEADFQAVTSPSVNPSATASSSSSAEILSENVLGKRSTVVASSAQSQQQEQKWSESFRSEVNPDQVVEDT